MADPQHASMIDGPAAFQAWRQMVERELRGRDFSVLQWRTRDGILVDPLYPPRADTLPLPGRGPRQWTLVQIIDDTDPERANEQALADIEGGATGLCLRFAGSPLAGGSGLPATSESLAIVLDGVDLAATHLRIDPHVKGSEIAAWLQALVARRGIAPELTDISFGLDPIGVAGAGPGRDTPLQTVFGGLVRSGFAGPIVQLDSRPLHEAGATEAQELAAILAGAAWCGRVLESAGHSADLAFGSLGASVSVDHDQFVSVAKLRALRLLWARFEEVCGVPSRGMPVHAETSRRIMTSAAPHTNLIRATIAAFSAAIGGADSIAVLPYTAGMAGGPSREARTLARNTQHLLMAETQVHRVVDPCAGSGAAEALTDALAERAWAEFQQIQREGGMVRSLDSGAFPARVADASAALRRSVAAGAVPLVGATVYRDPGETPQTAAPESEHTGPLAPVRLEEMAVS